MIELRERKLGALRDWLANHVNPQNKFFKSSYYDMADTIINMLNELDIENKNL